MKIKPVYNKTCPECKKPFIAHRKDKIFCNYKCRVNNYRKKQEEIVICEFCKKPFWRKRTDSLKLFCSKPCRDKKRQDSVKHAFRIYYKKMKNEGTLKPSIGTTFKGTEKRKKPDYTKKDEIDIWKNERESVKKLKKSVFNE